MTMISRFIRLIIIQLLSSHNQATFTQKMMLCFCSYAHHKNAGLVVEEQEKNAKSKFSLVSSYHALCSADRARYAG